MIRICCKAQRGKGAGRKDERDGEGPYNGVELVLKTMAMSIATVTTLTKR